TPFNPPSLLAFVLAAELAPQVRQLASQVCHAFLEFFVFEHQRFRNFQVVAAMAANGSVGLDALASIWAARQRLCAGLAALFPSPPFQPKRQPPKTGKS